MATLIGIVSQVVGEVFAVASDGSRRPISEGDRLYAGEQLVTGATGAVAVDMSNGEQLTLGRDSSLTLDTQLLGDNGDYRPPVVETPPATPSDADLTDVEQLQAAIEAGVDPTLQGEATAAGPGAGAGGAGGAGGGNSFVLLSEVGGAVDPTIGFPTEGLSETPLFPDAEVIATAEPDGTPTGGSAANALDEDGLPDGIIGGVNDLDGAATQVTGVLGYNFGPDGPGTFTWSTAGLAALGVSSGGAPLVYQVSPDGLTLTATAGESVVFVAQVTNLATGAYQFQLFAPLDHAAPELGDSDENDILYSFGYSITDGNGTPATGSLSILIDDDSPVQSGGEQERPWIRGLVHEDALGNGNAEPGSLPAQTTQAIGEPGTLNNLVDFGADGPGSFQLDTRAEALSDLQALELSSAGQALVYSVSADGTTLTATAGAQGAPVFTLVVGADGSYTFTLLGPIDHPQQDGVDSETLGSSELSLDFSKLLIATDFDGDAVPGGFVSGSFVIDIEDDVPVQSGGEERPVVLGQVQEDALSSGNTENSGQTLTASGAAGTLDALVEFGADGRGGFQLSQEPGALSGLQALGLTSGGVALVYSVSVDGTTLTATAGEGGQPIFNLVVRPDGSYDFTLQGPVDHPQQDGVDSETLGGSDLALDFSGVLVATDGDGDPIVGGLAEGSFVIDIEDDVPILKNLDPQQALPGGTVHEDLLSSPYSGNPDSGAQTLVVSTATGAGTLNSLVSFGADGPGAFGLVDGDAATALLQVQGLKSGGESLIYDVVETVVDGKLVSTTLTAVSADSLGNYPVFTLQVNADGSFSFTLQGPLDHPQANGDDGELWSDAGTTGIDFTQLFTATDGDGDPLQLPEGSSGLFVINVEDDVPELVTREPEYSLTLTYQGGDASLFNSYGYYIKGPDGVPVSGEVIWSNTRFLGIGSSVTLEGLDPDSVGFFIIPNGAFSGVGNGTEVTFQLVDGQWQAFANGAPLVGEGGASVVFDNPALNPGDKSHVEDNTAPGNQNWEDVSNGNSDNDYNDVNIQATWTSNTPPAIGGTVHEDKLDSPYAGNPEPGQALVVSTAAGAGSLASLVAFGADGRGSFGLVSSEAAASVLDGQGLTSADKPLVFTVSESFDDDGHLLSTTLTATAAADVGGYPVFTLVIDADGSFSFTLQGPIDHPQADGNDSELWASDGQIGIDFTHLLAITDGDGDPLQISEDADGLFVINIEDDVPTLSLGIDSQRLGQLEVVLDETRGEQDRYAANDDTSQGYVNDDASGALARTTTQISGGLSALFSVGAAAGADGQASLSGTLSFTGIPAQGLDTTLSASDGGAIRLVVDENDSQVLRGLDGSGDTVFTIAIVTVDGQPQLQTTLFEAIGHPDNDQRFDEAVDLLIKDGSLKLQYQVTLVDGDGDSVTRSASLELAGGKSSYFSFQDDGPKITAFSVAEGAKLYVDESVGLGGSSQNEPGQAPANDEVGHGNVLGYVRVAGGDLFNLSVDAGADGLDAARTRFELSLSSDGVDSGLDATAGGDILLSKDADGNILGKANGVTVFKISVNATDGNVSLEQYQAIEHGNNSSHDELASIKAGVLQLGVTVHDKDGDAQSASLDLGKVVGFEDDGPSAGSSQAAFALDDEGLANGINGGEDDVSGAYTTLTGTLDFTTGSDGLGSIALSGPSVLGSESVTSIWNAQTNTLTISSEARGVLLTVILTDPAAGTYSLALHQPLLHVAGLDENDITLQIGYTLTDGDGDTAEGQLDVLVNDDTPTIQALQPGFESQATLLGSNAGFDNSYGYYTRDAEGNPSVGKVIWADVKAEVAGITFDLEGLDPNEVGFFIIPDGAANAALSNGAEVTFEQDADGNWQALLGGVPLTGEGGANVLFDRAEFNLGGSHLQDNAAPGNQNWEDVTDTPDYDYNDVNTNVTWGMPLQVDETDLGTPQAAVSRDFSSAFNAEYGADGPGALTYGLVITSTDSGLVETASGQTVKLVLNGSVVEGRTETGNALVFTLSVDAAGVVTLTQLLAVVHPTAQPDELQLLGAGKVALQATISDADGDHSSASIDLGQVVGFRDDAPTAVNDTLADDVSRTAANQVIGNVTNLTGNDDFGSDGKSTTAPVQILGQGSQGGTLLIDVDGNLIYTAGSAASAGVETFSYQIQDGDGDTSVGTLTLNLTAKDPVGGQAFGQVDEDGLLGGLVDGPNDQPAEATIASGSLEYQVDSFGGFAWDACGLGSLSSGGSALEYQLSGDGKTLSAFDADGNPVFTLSLTNAATGDYRFELFKPLDHAAPSLPGTADENDLSLAFTYQVWDSSMPSAPAVGSLSISVDDDSPALPDDTAKSASEPQGIQTNLMIVLDLSGSMDDAPSGVSGISSKLELAKDAVQSLIDSYDARGDVMVRIVTFADSASAVGGVWMTASDAKAWLTALADNAGDGSTNYDDALSKAMNAFGSSGKLVGSDVQNVSYFLSDGQPTLSNSAAGNNSGSQYNPELGDGIDSTEEQAWSDFLNANDIKSYALGMGLGSDQDKTLLNPIAYDGTAGANTDAILVSNLNQLNDTLQGTVSGTVITGNVISEGGNGFGADGPAAQPIGQVMHDDLSYDVSSAGYDAASHVLTFTTQAGGTFSINLMTGAYSYSFNKDVANDQTETIRYTLVDHDGDAVTGELALTITDSSEVYAYDNYAQANVTQEWISPDPVSTVLANFSSTSNGSYPGNPWVFDVQDSFLPSGDERTVVTTSNVLNAAADKWGVTAIASSDTSGNSGVNGVRVEGGQLQLRDTNSSDGVSTKAVTPSFVIAQGSTGTLTFDVTQAAASTGDSFTWKLYQQSGNSWQEVTVTSQVQGGTINLLNLAGGTYRLYVEANDRTSSNPSRNNNQFRVTIDNITLITVAAAVLVETATAVSGNLITDPNTYLHSEHPWGAVDSQGSEGATLSVLDNGSYVAVTSSKAIDGQWGSLVLHSDGSYTYTPDAEYANLGKEDVFTYQLTQADGDVSTATLVVGIGTSAAPNVLSGTEGNDTALVGTAGSDVLLGLGGDDVLDGAAGDDRLEGGAGHDTLIGGMGNDILLGGADNDTLIGGVGDDILIGGGGQDTFVWNADDRGGNYHDVVKDFDLQGGDKLDLSQLLVGLSDPTDADALSQYLSFDFASDPGSTVISVSSSGHVGDAGGVDQTITLANTLVGGGAGSSTADIIDSMLDNHQLVA